MPKKPAVIWRSEYEKLIKRFIIAFVVVNLIWMGAWSFNYRTKYEPMMTELSQLFEQVGQKEVSVGGLKSAIHTYRVKQDVMKLLRTKGMSLGQGMDIADGIVAECSSNDLPIDLVMSLMRSESEFYVNAKSSVGAIGVMQLMPITFNETAKELGLDVGIQAAYDPRINIKVGCAKLKKLYKTYQKSGRSEAEVLRLALSAYNAGENGGIQPGYVNKVTKGIKDFKNFSNTEAYAAEPDKKQVAYVQQRKTPLDKVR